MATQQEAVTALADLLGLKQTLPQYRYALTGQGTGADTSDVDARPGWSWVRYDDNQSRVAQVFNHRYPGIPGDVPVIIGKERENDSYLQILSINWALYFEKITMDMLSQYVTPPHGPTHNAVTGGDPAFMDIRNLLPGRVRQTDVPGLQVYAETLFFDVGGTVTQWGGGVIDLSGYVPVVADSHRYALVTIDPSTNSLIAAGGPIVPDGDPAEPPAVPLGQIPLAVVLLQTGQTVIYEGGIDDYRLIFSGMGGPSATTFVNEIALLAESVFMLLTNHAIEGR